MERNIILVLITVLPALLSCASPPCTWSSPDRVAGASLVVNIASDKGIVAFAGVSPGDKEDSIWVLVGGHRATFGLSGGGRFQDLRLALTNRVLWLFWVEQHSDRRNPDDYLLAVSFKDQKWSRPDTVFRAKRISLREAASKFLQLDSVALLAIPAINPMIKGVIILRVAGASYSAQMESIRQFNYPRLGGSKSQGLILLTIGAESRPRMVEINSIWLTDVDHESGMVSVPRRAVFNQSRPAFDPVIVPSRLNMEILWTTDIDGDPSLRELMYGAQLIGHATISDRSIIAEGKSIGRPIGLVGTKFESPEVSVLFGIRNSLTSGYTLLLRKRSGGEWLPATHVVGGAINAYDAALTDSGAMAVLYSGYDRGVRGTYSITGSCEP
jgi:hypothetical protein